MFVYNNKFIYIENIIIVIVFGLLAYLFHHWWIVLFAALLMWTKTSENGETDDE